MGRMNRIEMLGVNPAHLSVVAEAVSALWKLPRRLFARFPGSLRDAGVPNAEQQQKTTADRMTG